MESQHRNSNKVAPDPFSHPNIKETKQSGYVRLTGCDSQTGYKMKLLKHEGAGQKCKKHIPIVFSGKYAIKFALAG